MRLYGRKFADKYIKKKIRPTSETRDAIIFSVDWDSYVCKCRIQGSSSYVNAYFPRNEATIPSWMKPGNAVRILHRAGVRGYFEVIGHGGAIPTPLPGYPERPSTSELGDEILTGCEMTVVEGTFCIHISEGTFRIDGDTYSATLEDLTSQYMLESEALAPTMNDDYPPMDMGGIAADQFTYMTETDAEFMAETDAMEMGALAEGIYCIDDPPAEGYFRYDAFVVGIDGVVDYLKGTAVLSNPVKPAIPADHILLGDYILVIGGTTELETSNIGQQWEARVASEISIDEMEDLAWSLATDYPECNITVRIKDQYGWEISGTYTVTLYRIIGTGQVWSYDTGYHSDTVVQSFSGSGYTFKYQRDQTLLTEMSPAFIAMTTDMSSNLVSLTLLNEFGIPVIGGPSTEATVDTVQSLVSASDVTVSWPSGHRAILTAEHDVTFAFSGGQSGDKLILSITQDGTGGRTFTWPSSIRFGAEITEIIISTEANSTSYVGFIYCASASKYDVVANVSGYGA